MATFYDFFDESLLYSPEGLGFGWDAWVSLRFHMGDLTCGFELTIFSNREA